MNPRPLGLLTLGLIALLTATPSSRAGLFEYVQKPDPSYQWKQVDSKATEAGTVTFLALTSQTWQGIPWTHQLTVYEPKEIAHPDAMLLLISGGSTDRQPKPEDHAQAFGLAKLCGARVAVLPQVPNQPLLGGRKEDDLITETFVRYLETKDEEWPLLFPMAKSVVKAMDAVQEFAKGQNKPVTRFVTTGASKRGWTTWLSGIVDDRVIAIAPMVIPTLDFRKQIPHQKEYYGFFSEQIEDYVRRGLLKNFDSPEKVKLWTMVDPYSYLDRLAKKPVLQINGTNDRYWTLDSMNLFWDAIKGPKNVVYVPNSGHNLQPNIQYATHGIGAFFRHAVTGRAMPKMSWRHRDGDGGTLELDITSEPAPKQAQLLFAKAETNDFRESKWEPVATATGTKMVLSVARPATGAASVFGDLTYEMDGFEYHLSTTIRQVGLKLHEVEKKAAE